MWQKNKTRDELEHDYNHWLDQGGCPRCGHDHVFIRRMVNTANRGHNHHPYTRQPFYWKFTCQECRAQWVSMTRFQGELAENS